MEIINNTPNFGMAFRPPSKGEMEQFTKYVTNDFKISSKLVKRALKADLKLHSNDKHFDFYFDSPKGMKIVPKSEIGKQMNLKNQFVMCKVKRGILYRFQEKYTSTTYKQTYNKAGLGKKLCMNIVRAANALKVRLTVQFNPFEALPDNYRVASKTVKNGEILADKQIAKLEAGRQIAVRNLQKKNTAVEEISSVYDTKVKSNIK